MDLDYIMEEHSPVCLGLIETIDRAAERMGPNRKSTAERLVQCCLLDVLPNDYEVACDFFRGIAQFSADGRREYLERVRLVFALYRGLVKLFGLGAEELDRARVRGELMKLIHDKYSKYSLTVCVCQLYTRFCSEDLNLDL